MKTNKVGFGMIIFGSGVLFFSIPAISLYAQSYFSQPEARLALMLNSEMRVYPDTTKLKSPGTDSSRVVDTVDTEPFPEETKTNLLPEKMSFMEKFLWGENGAVRKTGLTGPLTPESRKSEMQIRRTMLYAHQIGGFITWGSMIAASYFGQKIIDGKRNFRDTHQGFVTATIGSYALTGLLAVLSPPPLIRRGEASTTTIHKTLAWAHFAGMVITPILGQMIGGNRRFNISKAHVHQIAAYTTTAIFTLSMVVITF